MDKEALLLPINGRSVPFHISTIKNISMPEQDRYAYACMYINMYVYIYIYIYIHIYIYICMYTQIFVKIRVFSNVVIYKHISNPNPNSLMRLHGCVSICFREYIYVYINIYIYIYIYMYIYIRLYVHTCIYIN
jgi:hypothetical protein